MAYLPACIPAAVLLPVALLTTRSAALAGASIAGALYLESGKLKASLDGAVVTGRAVAFSQLRAFLSDPEISDSVAYAGVDIAPSADVTVVSLGATSEVTVSWARVDSGGTDFTVIGTTAATFSIPAGSGAYSAIQYWRATVDDGTSTVDLLLQVTLTRTVPSFNFGTETTGGGGNWGTAADRAMLDRHALGTPGNATKIVVHFRAETLVGTNIKGLIYDDNAGAPGDLVAVGAAVAVPAGASWVESAIADVPLAAGDYWIGFVADENTATADSGTSSTAPNTVLLNGTLSYASPPATAPGVDADYVPDLAVYCECTPA